ncbi:GABR2-like protein [Mya arenaria]|uniref:GABR2-like protein n=1 Tax=Mya arenaria TaxID=6604 RepID=A0ABY7E6X4_MYAAR|nr:GABR2-like protein [Mya arenaria]
MDMCLDQSAMFLSDRSAMFLSDRSAMFLSDRSAMFLSDRSHTHAMDGEPEGGEAGLWTFIVACGTATVGMMTSLSFLVFHIYHRRNKIVKMTSPAMNIVTSVGAMLLCFVCFLNGLDFLLRANIHVLSALCQYRMLTVNHDGTASLPGRGRRHHYQYRMLTVIHDGTASLPGRGRRHHYQYRMLTVIRDGRLFTGLLGLLAVDAVLLGLWQVIDPLSLHHTWLFERTLDESTEAGSDNITTPASVTVVRECSCNNYAVWLALHAVWKVALLAACLHLAWRTRVVSVPSLNDAGSTVTVIFLTVFVTLCAAMVTTSLRQHSDAVNIITTIAISACAIFVQIIHFLPKKEGLISALQSNLDLAKESLSKLPLTLDISGKHDSGMENDASSGEHENPEGEYDLLRTPRCEVPRDRSGLYRVENASESRDDSLEDAALQQTDVKIARSASVQSSKRSFVAEFTDITKSVAARLETAACINSDLRNSISADMERPYSETEWIYESNTDNDQMADSIAKSYNLGDNHELVSYLNTHLPRENSVFQIRRSRRHSSSSAMSFQSTGSGSCRSPDLDSVSVDVPSQSRDSASATPNSVQHADILRYYSYRHMNDGFQRFKTYRINRDFRRSGYRRRQSAPVARTPSNVSVAPPVPPRKKPVDIYAVPNVVQRPPRLYMNPKWPKDSFV